MLENINLAFQGVWSHKMRSFLTMLGIIIGIAAIITIVSTIQGTNEQIKENLIGAGNNVVRVQLTQDGNQVELGYMALPQGVSVITEEMRDEMSKLDSVADVALYHQRQWPDGVYVGNNSFSGNLYGIDSHYLPRRTMPLTTAGASARRTLPTVGRWRSSTPRRRRACFRVKTPSAAPWRSLASRSPWWA